MRVRPLLLLIVTLAIAPLSASLEVRLPNKEGSLRARAEVATGDTWAPDPACYLTDEEISGDLVESEPADAERSALACLSA